MKQIFVILVLFFCGFPMLADSLLHFTGEYKGVKYWNCSKMIPYNQDIRVEFIDSCAYVSYKNSERIDTFRYDKSIDNQYRYVHRIDSTRTYKHLIISRDSINLQIGEPSEENYFYYLDKLYETSICPECAGLKKRACPHCQGVGRKGEDLCPFCNGKRSISGTPCRLCKGKGTIMHQSKKRISHK